MAYKWKKQHEELTDDMKARGVVFASCLHVVGQDEEHTIHEVLRTDNDVYGKIERLKDVAFFKHMAKDFGYQVIETQWY